MHNKNDKSDKRRIRLDLDIYDPDQLEKKAHKSNNPKGRVPRGLPVGE
jgi:hypothetical protein